MEDPTYENDESDTSCESDYASNINATSNIRQPLQQINFIEPTEGSSQQNIFDMENNPNNNALDNCEDVIMSDENILENEDVAEEYDVEWQDPVGNHQRFICEVYDSITPEIAAALVGSSPIDFFSFYIDNEIFEMMTEQTNLYATQLLMSHKDIPEFSRFHAWTPTDTEEMKKFIGIVGYMGLVKLPRMERYWCKRKKLYQYSVVGQVMSRNRFELLLNLWHFSDNEACPEGDRGYKVVPLMNKLIEKFQKAYTPGAEFCIDESLVPFRGRLVMKQYIPQKTHKYGIKLFKLCSGTGYTWNMKLYCGKQWDRGASVPTNVVMELAQKVLNSGRTAVTDNYYTSLELANKLLDNQTHLLGTLRANRRGNPKEVTRKKLKPGEIFGKENRRGICVLKWRDRRDVTMLSTKHTLETVRVQTRTGNVEKPKAVLEYNKAKSSIDLSDQMASYSSALRKTVKWYRKIAIELIFGTSLVNAHFLYKSIQESSMSITDFKEAIIESLMFPESTQQFSTSSEKKGTHFLKKK